MSKARLLFAVGLIIGSACTDGTEDEVGTAAAALTPITWTNVVGASAVGNSLSKTAAEEQWNAGASSVETLSGDGFIEFTTGENTTDKMAGLSSDDANQGRADIDFAIQLRAGGTVGVYESGTQVFQGGAYAAGDRFRVQLLEGVVTYWHNGALLYTSSAAPTDPLRVDTSLRTPGATIREVQFEYLLFWTAEVGVHAAANDLVKTDPATTWQAGAISLRTITGDGAVEFTTGEATTAKVAGLGSGNSGAGLTDIEFGIYLKSTGRVSVMESGVGRGNFGPYGPGDIFRVEVAGGVVSYRQNGAIFYTSAVAPSFPLVLDTSLRDPGATINDARVEACPVPVQTFVDPVLWPRRALLEVDAAGDLMVVANPNASNDSPPTAAVYRRGAEGWALEQALSTSDGVSSPLDDTVATDGTTIVVGSVGELKAQIFRRDGASWVRERLARGCGEGLSWFGSTVAVQGNRVVVGENDSSLVHVFRRNASGWMREAILESPTGEAFHHFGAQVALGGDRLFVGAWGDDTAGLGLGAVYVFRRDNTLPDPGPATCDAPNAGKWQQEAVLFAPDPPAGSSFGAGKLDANASGTLLAAGHPGRGPGAAYLFANDGAGWAITAQLTPSHVLGGEGFGRSLALGGADPEAPDFIVVGEQAEEDFLPGEAYVFQRSGSIWTEAAWLRTPGPSAPSSFGRSVAATAGEFMIAEQGAQIATAFNRASVYVYDDDLTCPAP